MGFFSGDKSETEVDRRVEELVNNAKSDTVTEERLTKTDTSGIISRGIDMVDDPLIEYLNENEQPQFIFFSTYSIPPFKIPEIDAELSTGAQSRSAVCITDRRFIVVVSGTGAGSDVLLEIPFDSVEDFEAIPTDGEFGIDFHKVKLRVNDADIIRNIFSMFDWKEKESKDTDKIEIVIANVFDKSDIEDVNDYLNHLDLASYSKSQDSEELSNIDATSRINESETTTDGNENFRFSGAIQVSVDNG